MINFWLVMVPEKVQYSDKGNNSQFQGNVFFEHMQLWPFRIDETSINLYLIM